MLFTEVLPSFFRTLLNGRKVIIIQLGWQGSNKNKAHGGMELKQTTTIVLDFPRLLSTQRSGDFSVKNFAQFQETV
jgi:hypothetical protein